jgi:hypothetical protein
MNSHKASSSVVVVVAVSFIVWLVGVESAYMHTREDVPLLWIYNKFYTQQAATQFLLLFPVVWLTGIASACIRRGYKPVKNQAAVQILTQQSRTVLHCSGSGSDFCFILFGW